MSASSDGMHRQALWARHAMTRTFRTVGMVCRCVAQSISNAFAGYGGQSSRSGVRECTESG